MKTPSEPLYGFVPRMVTSRQVQKAQVRRDLPDATEKKKVNKNIGRGRESLQQTAALRAVQKDPSSQTKTSGLFPDD
jgi:hypothetical protein